MGIGGNDEERRAQVEEHARQAKQNKQAHKIKDAPPVASKCTVIGSSYGVGIGLYFQIIVWLRVLLFWLALASSFTFAAIMDDSRDNGMLAWMNIQLPGFEGVFKMSRPLFLGWISLVDAGSMAVFSVACMVLYKYAARFVKEVDDSTMEVSDYTVIIKGLPETTPIDIGQHFSKYGKVMDVVMVKDFGPLLNLAATATALEQQRRIAEERLKNGRNAVAYQRQMRRQEAKMAKFMEEAHEQLDTGFELKAVFVTFNTQLERAKCEAASPKRWLSSWFMRRTDRFLGKYRYWVEQAKPPEDYIYENLHYSRLARFIRMAAVRIVVLAILIISAAAVTKLMAINISSARNITWSNEVMNQEIETAIQTYPLNSTQLRQAPALANATFGKITAAVGQQAVQYLQEPAAYNRMNYCSIQLKQRCSEKLGAFLKTKLSMEPAERVSFVAAADSFLKAKDFHEAMKNCSESGNSCTYSMCYPCYCSLLSQVAPAEIMDSEWVYSVKQECSSYITLDMRATAMKGIISGVVVVLNIVLKMILQVLVRFEKYWTQSEQERAYAIMAFVSQLLNSVLVLLLVNARVDAGADFNSVLASSEKTSWGANLLLSGAYTDFSAAWYVDVGQSLQLIVIMNAVLTAVFAWMDWIMRKMRQGCLTNCVVTASQSMYNSAWIGLDFVLDYRVSDMMLGLWIILMFGSGMPGLYIYGIIWLIVLDITDRWYLSVMCKQPVRYGKSLPYLLLGVLPWAAATHCAFGLWMHTHFNGGHDDNVSDLANRAGTNVGSLAQGTAGTRITQLNGLPLLILLVVHLAIHVIIRTLMYFFSGKAFACCFAEEDDGPEVEISYETAMLATYSKGSGGGRKLAGTPTYRMPHHPRYKDMFDNAMYKPVWFKAFGRLRYTQLVSRPGGGFQISPEVILEHDQKDMEDNLASLPQELQKMARQLADGESADGKEKRNSIKPRTSLTGVLNAMRDKTKSVNIAVLAGIHTPSAEPSQTGEQTQRAPRLSNVAETSGSFVNAIPPRTSTTASDHTMFMAQHQSFIAQSPLSAAALPYPAMRSSGSDMQVAQIGMALDPRMSAVLPQPPAFPIAADGTAAGWYPAAFIAPIAVAGNPEAVGMQPATNLNCMAPCNMAGVVPVSEVQTSTNMAGYPAYSTAGPEIMPLQPGAGLNCLPPCSAGNTDYPGMQGQPWNPRQQAQIVNPMQPDFMPTSVDMPWNPLGVAMPLPAYSNTFGWGIGLPVVLPTSAGVAATSVPEAPWMTAPSLPAFARPSTLWDGVMAAAGQSNMSAGSFPSYSAMVAGHQQATTCNQLGMQPTAYAGSTYPAALESNLCAGATYSIGAIACQTKEAVMPIPAASTTLDCTGGIVGPVSAAEVAEVAANVTESCAISTSSPESGAASVQHHNGASSLAATAPSYVEGYCRRTESVKTMTQVQTPVECNAVAEVATSKSLLEINYDPATGTASIMVPAASAAEGMVEGQEQQSALPPVDAVAADPSAVQVIVAAPTASDISSDAAASKITEQQDSLAQAAEQQAPGPSQIANNSTATAAASIEVAEPAAEAEPQHDCQPSDAEESNSDEEGYKLEHQKGGGSSVGAAASSSPGSHGGQGGGKKKRRGKRGKKGKRH